jgi:uncharacterized membrane protein YuzA (DUF378 family)
VAQSGGLLWVPNEASAASPGGVININDAFLLPLANGVTPVGVALDKTGNLYISGSGTPGVAKLSVNGTYSFGQVIPAIETDLDVQVYNIGNMPLTLSTLASDPSTSADFYALADQSNSPACGPATSSYAGTGCWLGLGVTPSGAPPVIETATLTIDSNATNDAAASLAVSADAVNDARTATTTSFSGIVATTYPGKETITVTVAAASGTPIGIVELNVSGQATLSLPLTNGVASHTYSSLGGGNYKVSAVYQGTGVAGTSPDFAVSAAKTTFTVTLATPALTVSTPSTYVLYRGTYALTMGVSSTVGTPTGTLRVMNGSNPADPTQDPIPLDNPVFNTSNLAVGAYSLTIVYSGDQNYAPANAAVPAFEVVPPSVLITATPATLTVTPGTPGVVTLTLQSIAGYGGTTISLVPQCISGVPQYAECTFDSNAIALASGGSATIHMTLSTNVPVNVGTASVTGSGTPPWALAGVFGFGLIGLVFGRKTRFSGRALTIICLMLLFAGAVFGVTACTNSSYTHTPPAPVVATPAGAYNIGVAVYQFNANVTLPLPQPYLILPVTVK